MGSAAVSGPSPEPVQNDADYQVETTCRSTISGVNPGARIRLSLFIVLISSTTKPQDLSVGA